MYKPALILETTYRQSGEQKWLKLSKVLAEDTDFEIVIHSHNRGRVLELGQRERSKMPLPRP